MALDPQNFSVDDKKQVLDYFEYIATYWDDGILTLVHIKKYFGIELKEIRKRDFIRELTGDEKKNNDWSEEHYPNLVKLLNVL